MSWLRSLVRRLPDRAMPPVRALYCRLKGIGDPRYVRRSGFTYLPPADLRFHVGSVDPEEYVRIGRRCAEDVRRGLQHAGLDLDGVGSVLDFGCGTGRTLVWLRDAGPSLHGSDLHDGCVAWCRGHLEFASFSRNGELPPLPFDDGAFDVVYSLSVFTHLDEPGQFAWLGELGRVTRKGGVALLSIHGEYCHAGLPEEDLDRLHRHGFFSRPAHALWGVFPRYFNTYHTRSYVLERWARYFDVVDQIPRGVNDHQDLVVLRR